MTLRRFACIAVLAVIAGLLIMAAGPSADEKPIAPDHPAAKLIDAAMDQVNVTLIYDPSYRRLDYPMGDPPRAFGVCTDVIVRAYRDALNIDLQKEVHEDMRRAFNRYPKRWGLKTTDRNIDHRRVPNLRVFFKRHGETLNVTDNPDDYQPGDIVTQMVGGERPHIGIVTHYLSSDGKRPLIIHNIGWGTRLDDALFEHPITGHYRYKLAAM